MQKKESQRKKLKMTQDMLRQLEKQKNKVRYSYSDVFFIVFRLKSEKCSASLVTEITFRVGLFLF